MLIVVPNVAKSYSVNISKLWKVLLIMIGVCFAKEVINHNNIILFELPRYEFLYFDKKYYIHSLL